MIVTLFGKDIADNIVFFVCISVIEFSIILCFALIANAILRYDIVGKNLQQVTGSIFFTVFIRKNNIFLFPLG